jgi:hypothetical protein
LFGKDEAVLPPHFRHFLSSGTTDLKMTKFKNGALKLKTRETIF